MRIFLFTLLFPKESANYIRAYHLLAEIYDWTEHKHTRWALRTQKLLNDIREEK